MGSCGGGIGEMWGGVENMWRGVGEVWGNVPVRITTHIVSIVTGEGYYIFILKAVSLAGTCNEVRELNTLDQHIMHCARGYLIYGVINLLFYLYRMRACQGPHSSVFYKRFPRPTTVLYNTPWEDG